MQEQTYANLRVWDGIANGYVEADSISVANGLISAVGKRDPEARDMSGLTVIPGLMDAHVHMTLDPEIPSAEEQLRQKAPEIREKMLGRAERMVRAGLTTARDLGGGEWLELELRDRINRGEIIGPRLLCAGQPVTSIAGHCHFWGGESANTTDAFQVIDRQREHEVDLIKIMATGGNLTRGSSPGAAQFSRDETCKIVAYAKTAGYQVAAHCHGTEGIGNAAAAGVTTVEHCSWLANDGSRQDYDPEIASEMAAQGVWVSPTVNAGWARFRGGDGKFEARISKNFEGLKRAGVRLVASTDAGIPNVRHEDLSKALPVFSHYAGLSPFEALRSATSEAARALAIADIAGTITPGLSADLVFLEGDPLRDLACIQQPSLVMLRGREIEAKA